MNANYILTDPRQARHERWIRGLRSLLDCIEAAPELKGASAIGQTVFLNAGSAEDMKTIAQAAGGRWTKDVLDYSPDTFRLVRSFGPHQIIIFTARENVCERVVTGTREVTVEEHDPALLAAVPTKTVTKTVEDVEWVCPESLLALGERS